MKNLFLALTMIISTVSLASASDLASEIDDLYQSGKIHEGEYSVLKHLTNLEKRKVKYRSRREIVHAQLAKIEKLKRENKIDEGQYSAMLEIYKNTLRAVEIAD